MHVIAHACLVASVSANGCNERCSDLFDEQCNHRSLDTTSGSTPLPGMGFQPRLISLDPSRSCGLAFTIQCFPACACPSTVRSLTTRGSPTKQVVKHAPKALAIASPAQLATFQRQSNAGKPLPSTTLRDVLKHLNFPVPRRQLRNIKLWLLQLGAWFKAAGHFRAAIRQVYSVEALCSFGVCKLTDTDHSPV